MDENLDQAATSKASQYNLRYLYLAEIYRAVMTLLDEKSPSQLAETFRMALDIRPPYSENRSLFSLAIQAYEKGRAETTSKATRSVRANALEYARRHNREPETVAQFLLDVGGIKKAADYARDPEMIHHWAISDRD